MKDKNQEDQKVEVNLNLDTTPILYTDNIFMSSNEYGLVLDIGQNVVGTKQLRIVSRVGMSREHAKKFIEELGRLLAMTEGQKQTGVKAN